MCSASTTSGWPRGAASSEGIGDRTAEPLLGVRLLPADAEPDPDAEDDAQGPSNRPADQRPILVGDAEAVKVRSRLAELVCERPCFRPRDLEGLFGGCGRHGYLRSRGQNAAASARPSAPVTTSFSSRPTGFMSMVWPVGDVLTVPRQRAPG
jgi:hypothetical protein